MGVWWARRRRVAPLTGTLDGARRTAHPGTAGGREHPRLGTRISSARVATMVASVDRWARAFRAREQRPWSRAGGKVRSMRPWATAKHGDEGKKEKNRTAATRESAMRVRTIWLPVREGRRDMDGEGSHPKVDTITAMRVVGRAPREFRNVAVAVVHYCRHRTSPPGAARDTRHHNAPQTRQPRARHNMAQ